MSDILDHMPLHGQTPTPMTELHKLAYATGEYSSMYAVDVRGRETSLDGSPLEIWNEQSMLIGRSDDPTDRWLNNVITQASITGEQLEVAISTGLSFAVPRVETFRKLRASLRHIGYASEPGDVWLMHNNQQRKSIASDTLVMRIGQQGVLCNGVETALDTQEIIDDVFLPTLGKAFCDDDSDSNPYGPLSVQALDTVRKAWQQQGGRYLLDAYVILGHNSEPIATAAVSSLIEPGSQVSRIMHVGCLPEHRNRGFGTTVVSACIEDVMQQHKSPILITAPGSYPALFYQQRLGFGHLITTDSFRKSA